MADITLRSGRYTVDPLYQWDLDQVLQIYGLSVSKPEIHLHNNDMERSLVVESTVTTSGVIIVNIPNSVLQKSGKLTVYVCGYEGTTFKTHYKIEIPIKSRKKPADYTLDANDGEVYSFNKLSKRITDLEKAVNADGVSLFYSYSYNSNSQTLTESAVNTSDLKYIPLISNSLRAFKALVDKLKTLIVKNSETADQALAIAKGKNQALVFATIADMKTWLSSVDNRGVCFIGDTIYIKGEYAPSWWIKSVLDDVDETTGFYYEIIPIVQERAVVWESEPDDRPGNEMFISVDLSEYRQITVIFQESISEPHYYTHNVPIKNFEISNCYREHTEFAKIATVKWDDDGVFIFTEIPTSMILPIKIIGHKI